MSTLSRSGILAVAVSAALLMALTGCDGGKSTKHQSQKPASNTTGPTSTSCVLGSSTLGNCTL